MLTGDALLAKVKELTVTEPTKPAPTEQSIARTQRETTITKELMTEDKFLNWFDELEGFVFRSERFYDDFDHAAKTTDYASIVKWLQSAYEVGYNDGQQHSEVTNGTKKEN